MRACLLFVFLGVTARVKFFEPLTVHDAFDDDADFQV